MRWGKLAGVGLSLGTVVAGCGGAQTPPPAPAPVVVESAASVDPQAYAELSAFFARKRPHVSQCYANAFAQVEPQQRGAGYVTVAMDVLPSGRAENVRVADSTLKSAEVEGCVTALVSRWILPQPAQRMAFTFSYDFKPE
jgi:outer membrane biosynthesis protein TonB